MEMIVIFKKIDFKDINIIKEILYKYSDNITCDYSIGGIYMWKDFFNYTYCICEDTLFIKTNDNNDSSKIAFMMPVGKLSAINGIDFLLKEYKEITLNVVPYIYIDELLNNYNCKIIDNEAWYDYIYNPEKLAYLKGYEMKRKRNHVNAFLRNYDYEISEINNNNIKDIIEFFNNNFKNENKANPYFLHDFQATLEVLLNYEIYQFIGIVLYVDGKIIGFTIGEIIKEVLYVHIEKCLISYNGSYQFINMTFSKFIYEKYKVKYINRGENVGDDGLKKAKESYFPTIFYRKVNIVVSKN